MTLDQSNFLESGLTLSQVAKKAELTPRYILALARNGNAAEYTARKLGDICKVSPTFFLFGAKRARLDSSSTRRLTSDARAAKATKALTSPRRNAATDPRGLRIRRSHLRLF